MAQDTPKTEREKMLAGELYRGFDPELVRARMRANQILHTLNSVDESFPEQRLSLSHQLFHRFGKDAMVRSPFHCEYGTNISIDDGVFVNFNCIFLDVGAISIGHLTQIGSGVQILTADHPRDPALRRVGLESAQPVAIGRNIWIGSGAIILPGITVSDDAIIGAGSVVTHDIRAGATVVGNPARETRRSLERP